MKNNNLLSPKLPCLLWLLLGLWSRGTLAETGQHLDLTGHWAGYAAVGIFILAYALVIAEENLHLRKSKPVTVVAGIIWALVAIAYTGHDQPAYAAEAMRHNLLEFAELMLFLLAAMTYINTLEERNVFKALRAWLISAGFSLHAIYWLTGLLAFFISPLADNLTTALVMGAIVLAVGSGHPQFLVIGCINIVVAANAGGAFSPFGDITTLMVWQKGVVPFAQFFALFIPSLLNWLVPAACMASAVPRERPSVPKENIRVKPGGLVVIALFLTTIALTVILYHFLHLPPVLGMITGLGLLKVYGYRIRRNELRQWSPIPALPGWVDTEVFNEHYKLASKPFDIFISLKRVQWDTLMFFYGVILCVGGLGALGYLAHLSETLYTGLGPTAANILLGRVSGAHPLIL